MADFTEVAERIWVARYPWFDVNVTVIGAERGLLVVDTHGSAAAAQEVVDDVRRLGAGEVIGIVNTHWHFDHTFGNGTFRTAYGPVPIHAHENAVSELEEGAGRLQQRYVDDPEDAHAADVVALARHHGSLTRESRRRASRNRSTPAHAWSRTLTMW